ncbi:electron transport complex protein RnfB [Buchnera aphidicola (Aphis glycines)]|uniref:Ion-translocating oxidoreductase complex subunit B n=1 Tax=Buchnera aphidicola (Aphis glycines) TaxID=1265350 RepID=A0A0M4HI64_9GAMM|nr:electron transport complex protein RnfB [Buchnera aphidicola (Aphis glycines)]
MSTIIVILIFSLLSFLLGLILSYINYIVPVKKDPIIDKINNVLPQSQCAKCGYAGCYPYAKSIINNHEKINKCTPGGGELILKINKLLNLKKNLENKDITNKSILYTTVQINEKNCVGCSKCAIFCPVDAIIGAPNFVHTVVKKFCTGCNICLSHCPTNCIEIIKE